MLRPEEVELLVCGTETLDLHELRKATEYDGYQADDNIIWYDNRIFSIILAFTIIVNLSLIVSVYIRLKKFINNRIHIDKQGVPTYIYKLFFVVTCRIC